MIAVALLLYAYARGNRPSRGIERACWEDVAFNSPSTSSNSSAISICVASGVCCRSGTEILREADETDRREDEL